MASHRLARIVVLGLIAGRGRRRRILAVAPRAGAADRRRRARDRGPRCARGRRPTRGDQGAEGRPSPRRRRRRRAVGDRVDRGGGAGARGAGRRVGQSQPRLCRRARGGGRRARSRDRQGEVAAGNMREAQLNRTAYLARSDNASQQALDQAKNDAASARADVAEAEANHAAAVAGPTKEERFIADAQVKAAASALVVLERRLDKTILRAPADGIVSVIVAEIGENVRAGEPVLVIEETGKQWLSFNAREDLLHGLTVGARVDVARAGVQRTDAGGRHRACAAWAVRDLAGRARDRRSRSQHAAPAPRSAGRPDRVRAGHDGLAGAPRTRRPDKSR